MLPKILGFIFVGSLAAAWIFLGHDIRREVEEDFLQLPDLPAGFGLRSVTWNIYDHGTVAEKVLHGDYLRTLGYDRSARRFPAK
jgi:hypothetical protein